MRLTGLQLHRGSLTNELAMYSHSSESKPYLSHGANPRAVPQTVTGLLHPSQGGYQKRLFQVWRIAALCMWAPASPTMGDLRGQRRKRQRSMQMHPLALSMLIQGLVTRAEQA